MARRPLRSLGAAALLLALCSSCFTTALWQDYERDKASDEEEADTLMLVLVTPFTILLDLCTAPIQLALFGDEDEDDDC